MTEREKTVLLAYLETGSAKEAAHRLSIAVTTVRSHLEHVRQKMGATNTAHAAYLIGLGEPYPLKRG